MAELLPKEELQDILVYPNSDDTNNPVIRTVPAGRGKQIVTAHKAEATKEDPVPKHPDASPDDRDYRVCVYHVPVADGDHRSGIRLHGAPLRHAARRGHGAETACIE